MTYMDKILKEFGIERVPLVNMKERVIVTPEYYDVDTYAVQDELDMMPVGPCDPDMQERYVAHHARFTVDKVLEGIREHVEVEVVDSEKIPCGLTIRAKMDVVKKRK